MCDVVKVEPIRDRHDIGVAHFGKNLRIKGLRQVTEKPHPLLTSFVKVEPAPNQEPEVMKLYVDHEIKQEMAIGPTVVQPSALDLQQQNFSGGSTTLEEHIDTQAGDGRHTYKTRDEEFEEVHNIQISSSLVSSRTKLHVCSICKKVLKGRLGLKAHLNKHTGVRKYKCGKDYVHKSSFRYHYMFQHTDIRPHVCDVCNKVFLLKTKLNLHSRVHTKGKRYKCEECGKQYKHIRQYEEHVAFKHAGCRLYTCTVCKKEFQSNRCLRQHVRTHIVYKPYVCDICSKTFATKNLLKDHIVRVHSDQKPYTYL